MKYFIFTILIIQFTRLSGQDLDSLSSAYIKDFKETFKNEDFKIGNLTINKKSECVYFEIDIFPQKKGVYFIKQIFEYSEDFGYKNNSILNVIKIGEKQTSRLFNGKEPNPYRSYTGSVGDTIIIPIYWNKHVIANRFSSGNKQEHDIYSKIDFDELTVKNKERQLNWDVKNNVVELKVIDVFSDYIIHRSLQTETVVHTIQFEAISTGEFTLQIGGAELPIIIFPQGESIKKYVTQVIGHQWEERVSSDGLPYDYINQTQRAILRVGDKIDFRIMEYMQKVKNPLKPNLKLELNKKN